MNTFYFQNIKCKLSTFSKFQQFVELFQKRFAGGICDLRGAAVYSFAPDSTSNYQLYRAGRTQLLETAPQ